MEQKVVIASGPVIVKDGKLLLDKDEKDDFWKFIGGRVKEDESLEGTCIRRAKEELNAEVEIVKPLNPLILWENPQTKEKMQIVLINWLCNLKNPEELKCKEGIKEFAWIAIQDIKSEKIGVSPNVKTLIEKEF